MASIQDLYSTVREYNELTEFINTNYIEPLYNSWKRKSDILPGEARRLLDKAEQAFEMNADQFAFIEETLEEIEKTNPDVGAMYREEIRKHLNTALGNWNATRWNEIRHNDGAILKFAHNHALGRVSLNLHNVSWQVEKTILDQLRSDNTQPWNQASKEITVDGHKINIRSGFDVDHRCITTDVLVFPPSNPSGSHWHLVISENGDVIINEWREKS